MSITVGNTRYKWAAGFNRDIGDLQYVSVQPKSSGFVYGDRNYAVSKRKWDEGSTTQTWLFSVLTYTYWEELLAFYESLTEGEAAVAMTILTRNEFNDYYLCNSWMEKPIIGRDAQRGQQRYEQVTVRHDILTAVLEVP